MVNLTLLFLFVISLPTIQAQQQPFSWKKTTDPWYMPTEFTFKLANGELTIKGKTTPNYGPSCTNGCRETTAPDACTARLVKDKLGAVELPNVRIPAGYGNVEYITFDIQANGRILNYQVVKQNVVCPPCIQKAVNLVASLGKWYSAKEDGISVKSTVVVPVYFQ